MVVVKPACRSRSAAGFAATGSIAIGRISPTGRPDSTSNCAAALPSATLTYTRLLSPVHATVGSMTASNQLFAATRRTGARLRL